MAVETNNILFDLQLNASLVTKMDKNDSERSLQPFEMNPVSTIPLNRIFSVEVLLY